MKNKMALDWDLQLPNFADPGVLLRVAILANLCMLVGVILRQSQGWAPLEVFWSTASVGEPTLIVSILILALSWPRSSDKVRSFLALFVGAFSMLFISMIQPGWTRGSTLSGMINSTIVSVVLCLYFDWRYRRLSPALAEAKLEALVSRMRPHFLFNAINGIIMLLSKSPEDAEEALLDLADVFRALLKESGGMAKVIDEIDLTKKYLRIEQMRFRERMVVNINLDKSCNNVLIPTMILQPLAENAVIHGIESIGSGTIEITVFLKDGRLGIIIENPYMPKNQKRKIRESNGIAMENIRQRLSLIYDMEARMASGAKGDDMWRVAIHIPAHESLRPDAAIKK